MFDTAKDVMLDGDWCADVAQQLLEDPLNPDLVRAYKASVALRDRSWVAYVRNIKSAIPRK